MYSANVAKSETCETTVDPSLPLVLLTHSEQVEMQSPFTSSDSVTCRFDLQRVRIAPSFYAILFILETVREI